MSAVSEAYTSASAARWGPMVTTVKKVWAPRRITSCSKALAASRSVTPGFSMPKIAAMPSSAIRAARSSRRTSSGLLTIRAVRKWAYAWEMVAPGSCSPSRCHVAGNTPASSTARRPAATPKPSRTSRRASPGPAAGRLVISRTRVAIGPGSSV